LQPATTSSELSAKEYCQRLSPRPLSPRQPTKALMLVAALLKIGGLTTLEPSCSPGRCP
jgi:hypothetical protein